MATAAPPPPISRDTYPDYNKHDAKQSPWKYDGYRLFSKWLASEKTFFIVRQFGALNTRIILALQDEIVQLEQRLNRIDEEVSRKDLPDSTNNGSFRYDRSDERRYLVETILPEKLAKYNSFVNGYSQLVDRPPVYPDDLETVKKWLKISRPSSIEGVEQGYIDFDDDLIPIRPKVRSPFRNFLEKSNVLLKSSILKRYFGRNPSGFYDFERDGTYWQNDVRIEKFASVVIALIGLVMLVGPLWILEYVRGDADRLGIITAFITAFFIIVLLLTTARTFDALVAAAAYSAVLMVFLQLGTSTK